MMKIRKRKKEKELAAAIAQGRKLLAAQKEQEGFDFLSEAVRQFPEDAEIRLLYASILLPFRPDDVAAEAAKAVELGPDDPIILVRAAHLLLSRGESEAAQSCAVKANRLAQPDFILMPGLKHLNGLLAAFNGEDDVAEKNLRSAVESEPDNAPWARHLAVFLAERGRPTDAVAVLDEALKYVEEKDDLERMRAKLASEIGA